MPVINVNATTRARLRALATRPFRDTAVPRGDGTFDVPLSDDVHAALVAAQFAGETFDDTIERLASGKAN